LLLSCTTFRLPGSAHDGPYIPSADVEDRTRAKPVGCEEEDTPGGLLKSMDDISKAMLNSAVPTIVYVWPSGARAASAGVFITYAANVAAMAPTTHLGAAHPVGLSPGGGAGAEDKTLMTKVTNDAVAEIRGFAARRGRGAAVAVRSDPASLVRPAWRRQGAAAAPVDSVCPDAGPGRADRRFPGRERARIESRTVTDRSAGVSRDGVRRAGQRGVRGLA